MKIMNIRIDEKMAKIIEENSVSNAIKPSRYVRSLIEKGLVLEHQMRAGASVKGSSTKEIEYLYKIAEILVENTMLTRKLIRQSVQTREEHREILDVAREGSRSYVEKNF